MTQVATVQSYDPRAWARSWEDARAAEAEAAKAGRQLKGRIPARVLYVVLGVALFVAALGIWWLSSGDGEAALGDTTVEEQTEALAEAPPEISRSFRLSDIGELQSALAASGFDEALVAQLVAQARNHFAPGEEVRGTLNFTGVEGDALQFARLDLRKRDSSGVVLTQQGDTIAVEIVAANLTEQIFVRSGRIDEVSIYTSVLDAGIPNALVDDFFESLAFDFDFAREINSNDAFEIAYRQTVNEEGEPLGAPVLLYSAMTTPARSVGNYRFEQDGKAAWFDASGQNTRRSLMRTPVDGARITSRFGMRHHPIYNRSRLHGGVDFAAPTGTAIFASGSGTIEVARPAWNATRGNGSYIAILHDSGYRTLYLHMSAFADGIAPGVRVQQGQVIGAVGSTGGSTGPHLHYEVHKDGEKLDPLTVQGSDERRTLTGDSLLAFESARDEIELARQTAAQGAN